MGLYKVHITDMVLAYYWYVVLPVEIMGDKVCWWQTSAESKSKLTQPDRFLRDFLKNGLSPKALF